MIKGGNIITQGGEFVFDRAQTAGAGDLTQTRDKIYETGNDDSIGSNTGIPEITFDLESFDTTTEFEAFIVGEDPTSFSSTPGSNEIDFGDAVPKDIISLIKQSRNSSTIDGGTILPYLTLSAVTYRFGVGENATQSFTLNGDSILHVPGQPYIEEFTNTGVGPYTIARTAELYDDSGDEVYVTSVCLYDSADPQTFKRLYFDASGDSGYENTSTTFTLAEDESGTYDTIRVTYSSQTKEAYPHTGNNPDGQIIHPSTSVKPAAVRSQHLDVYIGTPGATPTFTRLTTVQSIEANWSVTLENDEELGNKYYISSDYDVPDVSGNIVVKPLNVADLRSKLSAITGVPTDEIIGPNSSQPVPVEMRIKHPDTGARLKTIYIPDARFNIPGLQAQVNTKLENTLNWTSDGGIMKVYNGARI